MTAVILIAYAIGAVAQCAFIVVAARNSGRRWTAKAYAAVVFWPIFWADVLFRIIVVGE